MRWLPVAAARLGDADLYSWWRSHGMDSTGEYVLWLFESAGLLHHVRVTSHRLVQQFKGVAACLAF